MTLNDYLNKEQQKFEDFKSWVRELRYYNGYSKFPAEMSGKEWEEKYAEWLLLDV